tara:strand:- start:1145 stop:1927 length:783 start_codon:yes stop_codon:yes gene_type:complete
MKQLFLKKILFLFSSIIILIGCSQVQNNQNNVELGTKLACNIFDDLQVGVMKDKIPVKEIKIMIKKLEAASMRSSDKVLESSKRFVLAAEEAATNYYVYPTFLPLAYDDTYEHMAIHVESYLALQELTKACEDEGVNITKTYIEESGEEIIKLDYYVPEKARVKNIDQVDKAIGDYLKNHSWGDFGAKCDEWLKMDYEISKDKTFIDNEKNKWIAQYYLKDGKFLGPNPLIYYLDIFTEDVNGHQNNKVGSHIAEGCDQW